MSPEVLTKWQGADASPPVVFPCSFSPQPRLFHGQVHTNGDVQVNQPFGFIFFSLERSQMLLLLNHPPSGG